MVVGDGVADLADARAQFGGGEVFGRGQIPESGHAAGSGVALAQQDAAAIAHHQQRAVEPDGFGLAQFHGQLRGGAFLARTAACGERADQAERIARQADGGAEFHQGLIEMAGLARVQPLLRDLAEAFAGAGGGDVGGIVGHAGDHAEHVAVQHGEGQVERDAADRGGGVIADAGEGADGVIVPRKAAGSGDLLRGAAQIAGARVVAEAAPQGQHVVFGGGGQGGNGGKAFEEALIVRDDGLRAGLLEHDLADPDGVRIARIAPGQIAMAAGVPLEQEAADPAVFNR